MAIKTNKNLAKKLDKKSSRKVILFGDWFFTLKSKEEEEEKEEDSARCEKPKRKKTIRSSKRNKIEWLQGKDQGDAVKIAVTKSKNNNQIEITENTDGKRWARDCEHENMKLIEMMDKIDLNLAEIQRAERKKATNNKENNKSDQNYSFEPQSELLVDCIRGRVR